MTYKNEIDATHPMDDSATDQTFAADALAMKLVGERYAKRDLVDLVRWLILRKPDGLLANYQAEARAAQNTKHDKSN